MFKNTINKAFQKKFANNIWKIEVDPYLHYLGIEVREEQTTLPQYTVLDFRGKTIREYDVPSEKDWMMEGIQKGFIILKKVGENTPVKEGVRVINSHSGQEVFTSYEYQLLDVCEDYVKVRHRSIVAGNEQFIRIEDGTVHDHIGIRVDQQLRDTVTFPIVYDNVPQFLSEEEIIDYLWLSQAGDCYVWCYHQKRTNGYCLILTLSDLNHVLYREVILDDMEKMIPQPYFQVGTQLFFLTHNKQEIVSYLV